MVSTPSAAIKEVSVQATVIGKRQRLYLLNPLVDSHPKTPPLTNKRMNS
jgi:hypothetical protein